MNPIPTSHHTQNQWATIPGPECNSYAVKLLEKEARGGKSPCSPT